MSDSDMWVKFNKDYDHRPSPRSIVAYKKGMHLRVPKTHADAAIEGGYAEASDHVPQAGDVKDGTQTVRVEKTRG